MNCLDRLKVYTFIFLFTLLFIGEFLINQITHSVLILVDSYYNLFQICTLIFILLDEKTSQLKSIRATFGWIRFSVLGNLISNTFFSALAFSLIIESMQLIIHTTHETTTLRPHLNLFAAVVSISVQLLSCGVIIRLLNKDRNNFSINGPNLQLHFVVRSKDDQLEHVTISDDQANQIIMNQSNMDYREMNNSDEMKKTFNSSINELKNNVLNSSLDGSQLKELERSKTFQQHLTLRIFRNFISCTFLIINSIIGCILFKTKYVDIDTVETALKMLDPISAIISVIILSLLVYPEVKESGLILLQSLPSHIDIDRLKQKLKKQFPMIYEIHELHVWSITKQRVIATCHIKLKHHFKSNEEFGQFFQALQMFFKHEGIDQATIQPEFICTNMLKSNSSSSTLNDENALLQRVASCLLKCNASSSVECEKNVCCHQKANAVESAEKSTQ